MICWSASSAGLSHFSSWSYSGSLDTIGSYSTLVNPSLGSKPQSWVLQGLRALALGLVTWVWIPGLPCNGCVTLNNLLNLSIPQLLSKQSIDVICYNQHPINMNYINEWWLLNKSKQVLYSLIWGIWVGFSYLKNISQLLKFHH